VVLNSDLLSRAQAYVLWAPRCNYGGAFFLLQVPAAKELIEKVGQINVGMETVSNPIPAVYTKSIESTCSPSRWTSSWRN
jgi:hypothetical protein